MRSSFETAISVQIDDDKITLAKQVEGLQRALTVQRLVHNWVRPHWGLPEGTTPAISIGFFTRPVILEELLCWRGFLLTTL